MRTPPSFPGILSNLGGHSIQIIGVNDADKGNSATGELMGLIPELDDIVRCVLHRRALGVAPQKDDGQALVDDETMLLELFQRTLKLFLCSDLLGNIASRVNIAVTRPFFISQ